MLDCRGRATVWITVVGQTQVKDNDITPTILSHQDPLDGTRGIVSSRWPVELLQTGQNVGSTIIRMTDEVERK